MNLVLCFINILNIIPLGEGASCSVISTPLRFGENLDGLERIESRKKNLKMTIFPTFKEISNFREISP